MVFELLVPETVTLLDHVGVGLCDEDRLLLPEDDPQPEADADPVADAEEESVCWRRRARGASRKALLKIDDSA